MEPVTHMLTGACLSRALGFNKRARFATLACVIAAELPDADYVYRLGGPVTYFQHHRGWTHALWSLPLQAALVVGIVYLWRVLKRRIKKKRRSSDAPPPFKPFALGLMALVALLSHLLLDWTNNYGVRPFAPWNPRWYSGDLVFIVEPVLLVVLALALLLPLAFSLANAEIGIRRERGGGQWLAVAALLGMAGLWYWRSVLHDVAVQAARQEQYPGGRALRVSADPYPVDVYHWHMVVETPNNFVTGTVDTRSGVMEMDQIATPKPPTTLSTLAAKHSLLGRVYLDWSQFPVTEEIGLARDIHPELGLEPVEQQFHVVQFRDPRFGYGILPSRSHSGNVLTGEVWVDNDRQVQRMYFGGAEQNP